ncbi:RNA-binding protein 1-like [Pyrus communis]|uniref:RNA-binding protein 1-like n=1 Tax=Pyrus communis TaxID=23211 RepID=UPI0035C14388
MDSDQAKLFVGGISRETNEETLRAHFRSYGTVLGSVIARDRSNHNPRGFGFVWFSDISSADKALEDPHVILGRTVEVKKAIPRPRNQHQSRMLSRSVENETQFRTKKIFVGGLSAGLTEDGFKNYFEKFGSVSDVVVMHDYKTRRPRGFGFITFDSEDSVENVMQESFHELNGRSVEVKRAVPKEENGNNESGYTDYAPRFPRIYPPYTCSPAPTYGVLPFPTPYNGLGPFAYGTTVYGGGWYPSVAARGTPYGIAPIAPQPWVFPYGNALHPGYMSGGGLAAGSYNGILGPAVFTGGKPNQVVFGSGLAPVNVKPSQVEVKKLDVDSRSNSTAVKKKNSKRS